MRIATPVDGTTWSPWFARMAEAPPVSPRPLTYPTSAGLPNVRLELRHGSARPTYHEVSSLSFLLGTVPGCDLRLPGADLPAVCCLITRQPERVELRKLAPLQPVIVNGHPATTGPLNHGDRISIGPVELLVQISGNQEKQADVADPCKPGCSPPDTKPREKVVNGPGTQEIERQQQEIVTARRELADLRQQLYDRYRQRRDRLAGMHEALRRAANKIQFKKREIEETAKQLAVQVEDLAAQQKRLEGRAEEESQERQRLDEQRHLLEQREQTLHGELADRLARCQAGEKQLAEEQQALKQSQVDHQAALVRLDRLQATLEEREKKIEERTQEIERRFQALQQATRELEGQAAEMDQCQARLQVEQDLLKEEKARQEASAAQLAQRAAALEGQQAMVASLRTRLERVREQIRRDEARLVEGQTRQEDAEAEVQQRAQEVQRLRADLDQERLLHEQERRLLEERRTLMETAVARLREAQESLVAQEAEVREREQRLENAAADHAEQGGLLRGRSDQLQQELERIAAERQALRQREAALAQSEQALASLQEQLRRRSEELAARQRSQEEYLRRQEENQATVAGQRSEIEQQRQQLEVQQAAARQEIERRAAEVERLRGELTSREERLAEQVERLKQAGRLIGAQRKTLAQERADREAEQRQLEGALTAARAELDRVQQEMAALQQNLPELEERAQGAVERLTQARAQLREHLNELHSYARQGREDLEALRGQIQAEVEQLHQQELTLHRQRDEHRLAVAAFRQQLIAWQGQVAEMKQSLAQGETRLERRLAEVDEQARQVDATSALLARQAEELSAKERVVAERRSEMEQHLEDMRQWYRRKLRELSGVASTGEEQSSEATSRANGQENSEEKEEAPDILLLTGEVDPGDRNLGELLRSLELVDGDTLTALLVEARRQRRSLRQLLLAGGYLTLYQIALIEAGNLDGLVLGPVRLIDRLRATAHEVVYHVFDPRRGEEAILRHLSEEDLQDAVRPDEFRQRFSAAAAIRHPNLAATLEVLDIADRPAVLQERLTGLPSSDWPVLAAVPGVWFRLLAQAALGLHTLHQAGLVHGHLTAGQILLTGDGTVKICGAGEPGWLAVPPVTGDEDPAADLLALGRIAASWTEGETSRKGVRPKPLPEALQAVRRRLLAESAEERYPDTSALQEDLERIGNEVPTNAAAWERLLAQVRAQTGDSNYRQSA